MKAVESPNGLGSSTGASIVILSGGSTTFEKELHTASGIRQDDGTGLVTFKDSVTIHSAETQTEFFSDAAFDFSAQEAFSSAGPIVFGTATAVDTDRDAVTITGNATSGITIRTTDPANGRITINSTVASSIPATVENAGLFITNEKADISINVPTSGTAGFLQRSPTDNRVQLAGSITTTGSRIEFESDVFISGTAGPTSSMALGAKGNSASTDAQSVRFAKDLHIAAPEKTVRGLSPWYSDANIILYGGTLDFFDGTPRAGLTALKDLVLLNGDPAGSPSMYDDGTPGTAADGNSGVAGLFAYHHAGRAGRTAPPNAVYAAALPDGTAIASVFTGAITAATLAGKTIAAYGNFYANGVDLLADSAWTLSVPDNNLAMASFAEAYRLGVSNCTVAVSGAGATGKYHAWIAAGAEGSAAAADAGGNAPVSTSVSGKTVSTGWSFSRPRILAENASLATGSQLSGTYTVFDDVIRVEFYDGAVSPAAATAANAKRIENSNNEIENAVAAGALTFNHNGTARTAFTGVFKDAACTVQTRDTTTANERGETVDLSVFYLRTNPADSSQRWNTDATGVSGGDTDASDGTTSTDRGREAAGGYAYELPAMRTSIPDIEIARALESLYESLRDEFKNRVAHYETATATPAVPNDAEGRRFTATGDRARPALVEVKAAQDLHVADPKNNASNYLPWDAHNYFELRWSEAVDIGTLADDAWNVRSTYDFDAATPVGGDTRMAGGELLVSGLFRAEPDGTPNLALAMGVRNGIVGTTPADADDQKSANGLYRKFDLEPTQAKLEGGQLIQSSVPAQSHRMRVYIAGYGEGPLPANTSSWKWFWPGYIDGIADPAGALAKAEANTLIRDRAAYPNAVEPYAENDPAYEQLTEAVDPAPAMTNKADIRITVPPYATAWDTTAPDIAAYRTKDAWDVAQNMFEISPVDTDGDGFIDRFEFHLFDDAPLYTSGEVSQWVSRQGWYAGTDRAAPTEPAPDKRGGIRAASMLKSLAGGTIDMTVGAFYIGTDIPSLTNAHNTAFGTSVTDNFFYKDGVINVLEDPYFSMFVSGMNWRMTDEIKVSYNMDEGYLTDLAGIRMQSYTPRTALNKTPPRFTLTIQPMGTKELYMVFSKPVKFGNLQNHVQIQETPTGPNLVDTAIEAVAKATIASDETLSKDAIIHLVRPLTLSELQTFMLAPIQVTFPDPETGLPLDVSAIEDEIGNFMQSTEKHRVTDIGINVVEPLYASDGVNTDGTFGAGAGALRVFDGSGRLLDRDITIGSRINPGVDAPTLTADDLQLFFDINPAKETMPTVYNDWLGRNAELWLPSILPSFNANANFAARSESPKATVDENRNLRNFIISANDSELEMGNEIQFLFKYGDLFCARLKDPADITSVDPWRFDISGIRMQRGGVTILNNVIDSQKREKTLLTIDMPKSGNLVIQVFTMDGNIVRTLERNKKGAGTYTYSWDGTNLAGNPVARGMYFIRVIGPEMDEIRKVMVVKE